MALDIKEVAQAVAISLSPRAPQDGGDVIKPVEITTPKLYGARTLGSCVIISLILQGEKLRLREVNKSAKITQLVSDRTRIQSQAISPSPRSLSSSAYSFAFRAHLVDQISGKGWGWDTRSHSHELCCYVEFPRTNACPLSLERVLVIQGLEWLPEVKCMANFSASCPCSWAFPGSV